MTSASPARRRFAWLIDAFVIDGRFGWPILVAFLAINTLVIVNAILHNPNVGYDAPDHLKYAQTLATGRLPTDADTREFFSPPLPYVPTALLWIAFDAAGRDGGREVALKLAQFFQVGFSLVLTLALVKTARLIRGGGAFVPACAVLLLGMVPAYYRTFAMIRGEPLLATLAMLGTFLTIRTFALRRPTLRAAAVLGVTLGGAVLSRQWAFFLLPALGAVGLWRVVVDRPHRAATIRAGLVTLATFVLVGGPFYLHLHNAFGSMSTFNREAKTEDDIDDDTKLSFTEASRRLFHAPVRHAFADHPALLFYADVWGDYWQYFVIYAIDRVDAKGRDHYVRSPAVERTVRYRKEKQSNYKTMPAYLGRACVAGAVPTAVCLVGLAGGLVALRRVRADGATIVLPTLALSALMTMAGYAWFVMRYPDDNGDTIKASYPLQVYAPLAILGAAVVGQIGRRWPRAGWGIVIVLGAVAAHGVPLCVTRYW